MSAGNWTPGPWEVKASKEHEVWGVFPLQVYALSNEADARLIASAPELADALADLLARVDGPWGDHENSESGKAVRSARLLLARISGVAGGMDRE